MPMERLAVAALGEKKDETGAAITSMIDSKRVARKHVGENLDGDKIFTL